MLYHVGASETGLALGDAGCVGEDFRYRIAQTARILWAVPKGSAAPPDGITAAESKAWRRWLRSKRALVASVLSMLADPFNAETTRARRLLGVKTRMVAKRVAFDLGVYLDRLSGRPSLAIKSLYA